MSLFKSRYPNRFEVKEMNNMFELVRISDELRTVGLSKKKVIEIEPVKEMLLKTCPTIEDYEDYLIAKWLYEECLKGDKDACRILEEGCKWENTGEN